MKKQNQPKSVRIESFAQLKAICDEPLICRFRLDEKVLEIPLIRVTPQIENQRAAIMRAVVPQWRDSRKDYDLFDAKYLEQKERAEKKARALVVYACCPSIAKSKPGLVAPDEIMKFIEESGVPEQVLTVIALTALTNGLEREVQSQANFYSTPGSES